MCLGHGSFFEKTGDQFEEAFFVPYCCLFVEIRARELFVVTDVAACSAEKIHYTSTLNYTNV